jgi:hypothetical protein
VSKERSYLKHSGTWCNTIGVVASQYMLSGIQGENCQKLTRVQLSDTSGQTHTRCLMDVAQTRAVGYSWTWRRRGCGRANSREFSADAMYATQQEADIHGIAFGQRLIDGTVEAQIAPGLSLELRVYVPGLEWPLMIDGAHVQWVSGQIVGLAFFRIRQTEQQRLDEVITNLNPYRNENDAR